MSSPAPSNAGGNAKKPLEQITFRFCSECSNMLYPKEDESSRRLLFTCRTCTYSEEATSMCIFRNVLNNAAGETAGVTQDVGSDPTVGASSPDCSPIVYVWCGLCHRPINCEVCGEDYAIISANCHTRFVEEPADQEPDAISWNPSDDDDLSDYMQEAEGCWQGFLEEEDEDEMLGSDPINHYAKQESLATSTDSGMVVQALT